jgi:hypothetical protein
MAFWPSRHQIAETRRQAPCPSTSGRFALIFDRLGDISDGTFAQPSMAFYRVIAVSGLKLLQEPDQAYRAQISGQRPQSSYANLL